MWSEGNADRHRFDVARESRNTPVCPRARSMSALLESQPSGQDDTARAHLLARGLDRGCGPAGRLRHGDRQLPARTLGEEGERLLKEAAQEGNFVRETRADARGERRF